MRDDILKNTAILFFLTAMGVLLSVLFLGHFSLTESLVENHVSKEYHREAILQQAEKKGFLNKNVETTLRFVPQLKEILNAARNQLEKEINMRESKITGPPKGVNEWEYRMSGEEVKSYTLLLTKHAAQGAVVKNPDLFFFFGFVLAVLGGLLYSLPIFLKPSGIKNNNIFRNSATRGASLFWRFFFSAVIIIAVLAAGMSENLFLAILSAVVALTILLLVKHWEKKKKEIGAARSNSPSVTGWIGIITGTLLIGFYVLLYWHPAYLVNWIILLDPLSRWLSGGEASQWFLYGFLYTLVILVMGIRMFARYRNNNYQLLRTSSVMFFQLAFAFLIPEILVRFNQPYYDFKNIWPLDYDFFFEWNLNQMLASGTLGIFMLVWGIMLIVIAVPVLSYFYGKRWYCSWVCGCGGLAETAGDPYRHLSDNSLRAWRIERYLVHGVLVFSVVMTVMVLYTYFSGSSQILGFDSFKVRAWYGFMIGAAFAGVVGTGFYPLMGNRVWCRFGCPLAAYLGLVQRFRSRFRITTNGGQCISCGNCSAYCEMGIDVRWYAQRGQDIIRSSCVGCGICSAVCPRGVLRLENASGDVTTRASEQRILNISGGKVELRS